MRIEWRVGQKCLVKNIMTAEPATIIGFIVDQIPVHWKDQTTYSNRQDDTFLLVKFDREKDDNSFGYAAVYVSIYNYFRENSLDTDIELLYREAGTSPQNVIDRMKGNRVFTTKVSYDARYEEGFVDPAQAQYEK